MTKNKRALIVATSSQAVFYLIWAFVAWDMMWIANLGEFEPVERLASLAVWLFYSSLVTFMPTAFILDPDTPL